MQPEPFDDRVRSWSETEPVVIDLPDTAPVRPRRSLWGAFLLATLTGLTTLGLGVAAIRPQIIDRARDRGPMEASASTATPAGGEERAPIVAAARSLTSGRPGSTRILVSGAARADITTVDVTVAVGGHLIAGSVLLGDGTRDEVADQPWSAIVDVPPGQVPIRRRRHGSPSAGSRRAATRAPRRWSSRSATVAAADERSADRLAQRAPDPAGGRGDRRPSAASRPGAGKRYDGPWTWTAATTSPLASAIARRDRGDALGELVVGPGEAVELRPRGAARGGRVGSVIVRAVKRSSGSREVALDAAGGGWARNTRPDETACIGMRDAGPVADPDRVRVGCRPGRRSGPSRRRGSTARRPRRSTPRARRGAAGRSRRGSRVEPRPVGERLDPRPEPVAGVARDLLDGALAGERREHPRGGRLRQVDPLGDLGHADGPVGQRRRAPQRPARWTGLWTPRSLVG